MKTPSHRSRKDEGEAGPLFCARCAAELQPGSGELYEIRIEARADPFPPKFAGSENAVTTRREIRKLLNQLENTSARESLEQVYRRMVIHLCVACYQRWIENPAGQEQAG